MVLKLPIFGLFNFMTEFRLWSEWSWRFRTWPQILPCQSFAFHSFSPFSLHGFWHFIFYFQVKWSLFSSTLKLSSRYIPQSFEIDDRLYRKPHHFSYKSYWLVLVEVKTLIYAVILEYSTKNDGYKLKSLTQRAKAVCKSNNELFSNFSQLNKVLR